MIIPKISQANGSLRRVFSRIDAKSFDAFMVVG
jgi:hypothetical protein